MGSGKSTLLKKLSREGLLCVDLDDWIFAQHGADFSDLGDYIRQVGWDKFREVETAALAELLEAGEDLLLALGGGTLDRAENQELIKTHFTLICLDVDFHTCFDRISDDKNRPLAQELDKIELEELYLKRQEIYEIAKKKLNKNDVEKIYTFDDLLR
jgi:shikimate kinase